MKQKMAQNMKQNRRNFPILPGSLYFATAPWHAYFAAFRFLLNHVAGLVATVRSVCLWAMTRCGNAVPPRGNGVAG